MKKRKIFLWLSLVMVMLFGLNGTSYSGTVPVPDPCGPVPTSCTLYDSSGNPSAFTIETFPEGGVWPIPGSNGFQWRYKINSSIPGIKSIAILAPHCCPANNYSGGTGIKLPGQGAVTGFGAGNFQDWVIMLNPLSSTPDFYSEKNVPSQRTSIQVKTTDKIYYCTAIAGPACPNEQTIIAASTFEVIQMDNGDTVCLNKNPNYPCPIAVYCPGEENAGQELPSKPIDQVLQANVQSSTGFEPVFYAGVPEQACPKIFLRSAPDSQESTWVCSGGRCYYR
jgi:hypothetical protein